MRSIVVKPKSVQELEFLSELLEKLGVDLKILTNEDMGDLGLALVMKDVDRNEVVSEDLKFRTWVLSQFLLKRAKIPPKHTSIQISQL